jgi:hypothetical protein
MPQKSSRIEQIKENESNLERNCWCQKLNVEIEYIGKILALDAIHLGLTMFSSIKNGITFFTCFNMSIYQKEQRR